MRRKVLIVDDSGFDREAMKKTFLLRAEKVEVVFAKNGEEGVAKAREYQPDIVFADTVFPGIDGFEVCRQIKSMDKQRAKVVVMTGSVSAIDLGKAREAGAD